MEAARALLEAGADPGLPSAAGRTALHDSAAAGRDEAFELLVEELGVKLNGLDARYFQWEKTFPR